MTISVNHGLSLYSLHRNEIPKLDFEKHRIKNELEKVMKMNHVGFS